MAVWHGDVRGEGTYDRRYLAPNSSDEVFAREAMVRLLRSAEPLPRELRDCLADLFEPQDGEGIARQIVFEKRVGIRDIMNDSAIATYILEQVGSGTQVEAAIAAAMKRYDKGRTTIYNIWMRHRPGFEAMFPEYFQSPKK
jgi:hypothetical protein